MKRQWTNLYPNHVKGCLYSPHNPKPESKKLEDVGLTEIAKKIVGRILLPSQQRHRIAPLSTGDVISAQLCTKYSFLWTLRHCHMLAEFIRCFMAYALVSIALHHCPCALRGIIN